ncbi:MAG TPA: hypothetical protein VND64_33265, partial [Pirellulales bacterium]|nr:hypothetical protein [Pirellulales bacterium]
SIGPDGRSVLGIGSDSVREFDVVTSQPAGPLLAHGEQARSAFYCPDGRSILTVGDRNDIRLWDRSGGQKIGEGPAGAEIDRLDFSANGAYVAVARADRSVSIHRIPTGELQGPPWKLPPQYSGLVLGPDGRAAYTHDASGGVREWDAARGNILRVWKAPGRVQHIRFVEGKIVVITGDGEHLARAWDLESGRPLSGSLSDIAGTIFSFAFSPDGRSILTGLWDHHDARLWDTATGKPIGPPIHHGEAVYHVAFTSDGSRMMSISVNHEFRSQEVPVPLPGDAERIRCWVEVLTGMELDAEGTLRDLDAGAVERRRERLGELGGPPDGVDG